MALYDAPGEVLGEELTSSGFPGLIFILGLMAFHRQVCVCACVHASVLACVCVCARAYLSLLLVLSFMLDSFLCSHAECELRVGISHYRA